ncbi:MAG: response regulator [Methylococcaceae bacterium]|nr:response regulator [Methylococcaceae bacterium]
MKTNSTILIIDDDEISLLILQNAFEVEGYNVIATTNSMKAEDLYNAHSPYAVILDIFMPERDGFEVIKELKKLSKTCHVIAISSNERYLPAIKALGATAALPKSTMPDQIVAAIKAL